MKQERGEIFFFYRPKVEEKQDPASGKEGAKKETKKDDGHPDTSKSSSDSVASEEDWFFPNLSRRLH